MVASPAILHRTSWRAIFISTMQTGCSSARTAAITTGSALRYSLALCGCSVPFSKIRHRHRRRSCGSQAASWRSTSRANGWRNIARPRDDGGTARASATIMATRRHLKVCAPNNDLADISGTFGVVGLVCLSDQRELDPTPHDGGSALQGFDGDIAIGGIKHAVYLCPAGMHQ